VGFLFTAENPGNRGTLKSRIEVDPRELVKNSKSWFSRRDNPGYSKKIC
jgi:hypothetical protein